MFQVPRSKTTPPPVPSEHIRRPAVEAELDRATDRELALVSAPPGSGKTSLLASWVGADPDQPTAWVRLDPEDADPRRLWSAVLAALTDLPAVPASSRLHRLVVSRTTVELDFLTELVECLAALPDPDPARPRRRRTTSSDPASRHGLEMLVRGRPARDPPGPVHPSGSPPAAAPDADGGAPLRAALRSSWRSPAAETTTLMERSGLALTPHQVALLHARTGGWIAGLRLAAQELRDHPDPDRFLDAFSGDEHAVADYLVDEVLTSVGDQQRETLRRVSVAERLPAGLAVELAEHEDAPDVLDDLVREHRPRDRYRRGRRRSTAWPSSCARTWSRTWAATDPTSSPRLHRRAACWWSDRRPAGRGPGPRRADRRHRFPGRPARPVGRPVGGARRAGAVGARARGGGRTGVDGGPAAGDRRRPRAPRAWGTPTGLRAACGARAGPDPLPAGSDDEAFRTATERLAGRAPTGHGPPSRSPPSRRSAPSPSSGAGPPPWSRTSPRPWTNWTPGSSSRGGTGSTSSGSGAGASSPRGLWSAGDVRRAAVGGRRGARRGRRAGAGGLPVGGPRPRRGRPHRADRGRPPRRPGRRAPRPPGLEQRLRTRSVRPAPGAPVRAARRPRRRHCSTSASGRAGCSSSSRRVPTSVTIRSPPSSRRRPPLLEHRAALSLGHPTAATGVVGWLAGPLPGVSGAAPPAGVDAGRPPGRTTPPGRPSRPWSPATPDPSCRPP